MAERRALVEGLKTRAEPNRTAEEQFVYAERGKAAAPAAVPTVTPNSSPNTTIPPTLRAPFTTRIRADMAQALKRASLERQLEHVEPNTVQDILEAALEPWLKANGYL